jgi:hypothetical protein
VKTNVLFVSMSLYFLCDGIFAFNKEKNTQLMLIYRQVYGESQFMTEQLLFAQKAEQALHMLEGAKNSDDLVGCKTYLSQHIDNFLALQPTSEENTRLEKLAKNKFYDDVPYRYEILPKLHGYTLSNMSKPREFTNWIKANLKKSHHYLIKEYYRDLIIYHLDDFAKLMPTSTDIVELTKVLISCQTAPEKIIPALIAIKKRFALLPNLLMTDRIKILAPGCNTPHTQYASAIRDFITANLGSLITPTSSLADFLALQKLIHQLQVPRDDSEVLSNSIDSLVSLKRVFLRIVGTGDIASVLAPGISHPTSSYVDALNKLRGEFIPNR